MRALLLALAIILVVGCSRTEITDDSTTTFNIGELTGGTPLPPPNFPASPGAAPVVFVFEVVDNAQPSGFRRITSLSMSLAAGSASVRLSVHELLDNGNLGRELTADEVGQINAGSVRDPAIAAHKETDGRWLSYTPLALGTTFATISTSNTGSVQLELVVSA